MANLQAFISVDRSCVQVGSTVSVTLTVVNNTGSPITLSSVNPFISPSGSSGARALPLVSPQITGPVAGVSTQVPANGSLSLSWGENFLGAMPALTAQGDGQYTLSAGVQTTEPAVYNTAAPAQVSVYPIVPGVGTSTAQSPGVGFPPFPVPGQAQFENNLSSGLVPVLFGP